MLRQGLLFQDYGSRHSAYDKSIQFPAILGGDARQFEFRCDGFRRLKALRPAPRPAVVAADRGEVRPELLSIAGHRMTLSALSRCVEHFPAASSIAGQRQDGLWVRIITHRDAS